MLISVLFFAFTYTLQKFLQALNIIRLLFSIILL